MATKKKTTETTEPAPSAEADSLDAMTRELVEIRAQVERFTEHVRGEVAKMAGQIGRLTDRMNEEQARRNELQKEWEAMRKAWQAHHRESSDAVTSSGALARKVSESLKKLEERVRHTADPRVLMKPLQEEVGKLTDGLRRADGKIDRVVAGLREDVCKVLPDLRRGGRPKSD